MKQRLFLYTKDVQRITSFGERTSRNLIRKIRTVFGKEPHQPITVAEFSVYMNVSEEDVHRVLEEWRK